jgi:hypothetical protein
MKIITMLSLLLPAFATAIISVSTSTSSINSGKEIVSKGSQSADIGPQTMSEQFHPKVTNAPNHADTFMGKLRRKFDDYNEGVKQKAERAKEDENKYARLARQAHNENVLNECLQGIRDLSGPRSTHPVNRSQAITVENDFRKLMISTIEEDFKRWLEADKITGGVKTVAAKDVDVEFDRVFAQAGNDDHDTSIADALDASTTHPSKTAESTQLDHAGAQLHTRPQALGNTEAFDVILSTLRHDIRHEHCGDLNSMLHLKEVLDLTMEVWELLSGITLHDEHPRFERVCRDGRG